MSGSERPARFWIAGTLRWGSYLSAGLMVVGLIWVLSTPNVPLQLGPAIPLGLLPGQLLAGNPYAVIQTGVLLLLLTPLLRIAVAAVTFWLDRERLYTLVSLAVLAIILLGLWLARPGG